jgi:GTP cyclohydrolase II
MAHSNQHVSAAEEAREGETMKLTNWCELPTAEGLFRMYDSGDDSTRVVSFGDIHALPDPVLVRVHSSCMASELFRALDCDCADQLHESLRLIAGEGGGIVIHLQQEGRGQGLSRKIEAVRLMQTQGLDTAASFDALGFEHDPRDYGRATRVLTALGIKQVRLITNNPRKVRYLDAAGISVVERMPTRPTIRDENRDYLASKNRRLGHLIELSG